MTAPQNPRVTQADEEWAEEVASAANIVTNGGYYEIDIDAVTLVIARHREAADAASKAREAALVEALHLAASRFQVASVDAILAGETRLSADCIAWANYCARAALPKEPDA